MCGGEAYLARTPDELARCERMILPGVGAFAHAMENLEAAGFADELPGLVEMQGIPLLGICLGMQLLAQSGSEGGESRGLGLLQGRVERLAPSDGERVPHIGWNDVTMTALSPLFEGITTGTDFYFVHSYRLESPNEEILATTDYCGETVAAAGRDHVMAVQFHPEKSQEDGFRLLRNFLDY